MQKKAQLMSKWAEIRNNYVDDDGIMYIDAWETGEDNDEGEVIAMIKPLADQKDAYQVYYLDHEAANDIYAQQIINEGISILKDDGVISLTAYASEALKETLASHFDFVYFTVLKSWALSKIKSIGYNDIDSFLEDYTADTTQGWIQEAFKNAALINISIEQNKKNTANK